MAEQRSTPFPREWQRADDRRYEDDRPRVEVPIDIEKLIEKKLSLSAYKFGLAMFLLVSFAVYWTWRVNDLWNESNHWRNEVKTQIDSLVSSIRDNTGELKEIRQGLQDVRNDKEILRLGDLGENCLLLQSANPNLVCPQVLLELGFARRGAATPRNQQAQGSTPQQRTR